VTLARARKSLLKIVFAIGLGGALMPAHAGGPPQLCPLPPFKPAPRAAKKLPKNGAVTIDADSVDALRNGVSVFKGNVLVRQNDDRLSAARMAYHSYQRSIFASGDVLYSSPTLEVRGTHGRYFLKTGLGDFFGADYRLPQRSGRGHAKKVALTGPGLSRLHEVSYTTCPIGRNDWSLNASTVKLNRNTEVGVAYNATLDFYGVPIFYTPYLSFPLTDERKSGFLSPVIGYSGSRGIDITEPYYFNIAPNFDATLAPRILGRRGVLVNSQFRYLLKGTEGELDFSILPYDREAHRQRRHFHFDNATRISDEWRFNANLNHVSDPNYFADFGNSLSEAATVHQVSNVQIGYNQTSWSFLTRFRSYQTLNAYGTRLRPPYRELPQILLDWRPPPDNYRLDYGVDDELVRFAYPGRVGAARLHVRPHLDYNFGSHALYLKPAAKFDLAEYQLYNVHKPRQPTDVSRAAPVLSLDTGMVLERNTVFGDLVETLEPRLFYLYVPYRDQTDIPLFDTHDAPFNFIQLFADNRFNGADRLGDANQLSYALTTRLLHPDTGRELLAASVGQIHYFRDRLVTLPGRAPKTRAESDIVGELRLSLDPHWSSMARLQWNPKTRQNDVGALRVQYRAGPRKVANAAYLFRRDRIEETDFSVAWPISHHWRVVGRWNYSLRDKQTRETFAGFEYENCCWAFLFLDRRYLRPTGRITHGIYLELQFKGLGRLGRDLSELLERGILGYGDQEY
jgi:LPS-assembly protein